MLQGWKALGGGGRARRSQVLCTAEGGCPALPRASDGELLGLSLEGGTAPPCCLSCGFLQRLQGHEQQFSLVTLDPQRQMI